MFPLAGIPDALPQFFDLGLPGPAFDEEMMLRLSLTAVAPPAFVGPDRLRGLSQIRANRRMAREELEVPAGNSLALPLNVLLYFCP